MADPGQIAGDPVRLKNEAGALREDPMVLADDPGRLIFELFIANGRH